MTNVVFDLIKSLLVSGGTIGLINLFSLDLANKDIYILLLLYPLSIVPFTYMTARFFK
jgi:hypothetical protein